MKQWIEIGQRRMDGGGPVNINIPKLIDTRALITGNSGAGKSRLMRRLAEQAFGNVQVIVLDPEGEFSTLREKHDFLLAGRGGEVLAEPRAAALLARRLVELRVSAVLDVYELRLQERRSFVRLFLEALIDLPKDLYAPVLVLLDEAHLFAPEGKDEAESRNAVIDLMTRGRKRGICGVLASQRLSKLDKDAAAEAKNIFIGGITLDVDQKRAADALGLATKEERLALRDVPAGEFLAYGPAIDIRGVVRFHSGETYTTHPKAGERHKLGTTVTPEAIRKIAGELKDLPQKADAEIKTLQQAQLEIRELKRQLKQQPKPAALPKVETVTRETPVLRAKELKRIESLAKLLETCANRMTEAGQGIGRERAEIVAALQRARQEVVDKRDIERAAVPPQVRSGTATALARAWQDNNREEPSNGNGSAIGKSGLRRILIALAQQPRGLSAAQIGVRASLSSKSGTFDTYLSRARTSGWIKGEKDQLQITDEGYAALGKYEPLPTGAALRSHWAAQMGGSGATKMLQAIVDRHPGTITREELARTVGMALSGTFDTYLSRLRSLELIQGKSALRASDDLFD